jgi:hypothetical protein
MRSGDIYYLALTLYLAGMIEDLRGVRALEEPLPQPGHPSI